MEQVDRILKILAELMANDVKQTTAAVEIVEAVKSLQLKLTALESKVRDIENSSQGNLLRLRRQDGPP